MKTVATSILSGVLFVALFGVFFAAQGSAQNKDINATYRLIQADQEWQGTDLVVEPGQLICVKASGLWTHGVQGIQRITPYYGPRGFGKDEAGLVPEVVSRTGALIGRIGDNGAFLIEDFLCFIPAASGELRLQMNDRPGTFGNNAGTMKVQITMQPAN